MTGPRDRSQTKEEQHAPEDEVIHDTSAPEREENLGASDVGAGSEIPKISEDRKSVV